MEVAYRSNQCKIFAMSENMDACLRYMRQEGTSITTRLVALTEMMHFLTRSIPTRCNQAFELHSCEWMTNDSIYCRNFEVYYDFPLPTFFYSNQVYESSFWTGYTTHSNHDCANNY
jgi:hypothetical protein